MPRICKNGRKREGEMRNELGVMACVILVSFLVFASTAGSMEKGIATQWHFDEGEGISASGSGLQPHKIDLPKTVRWVTGKKGKAIYLDGTINGGYSGLKLNLPEGGTISLWVNPEFGSDSALALKLSNILMITGSAGRFELEFAYTGGDNRKPARDFTWRCLDGGKDWTDQYGIREADSSYQKGVWQFWAATWKNLPDGQVQMELFVDGVSKGIAYIPVGRGPKGDFNLLALSSWGWNLKGAIDELTIYNYPLSKEEIQKAYNEN